MGEETEAQGHIVAGGARDSYPDLCVPELSPYPYMCCLLHPPGMGDVPEPHDLHLVWGLRDAESKPQAALTFGPGFPGRVTRILNERGAGRMRDL